MKNLVLVMLVAWAISAFWAYHPDLPATEVEAAYANADSQFPMVKGVRLHVRDQGPKDKPAILLIHGFSSSLHTWDEWANALSQDFRVVRFDLPGHGLTGPVEDSDYSTDRIHRLIEGLREKLGIERWSVAGNSLGGLIGWSYAVATPDKVERLVLLDSAGFPRETWPLAIRAARSPIITTLFGKLTPRALVVKNLSEVYHHDDRITDTLVTRYHTIMRREGNRDATATLMQQPEEGFPNPDTIKTLPMPVLLMWGEKDPWVPLTELEKFKAALPKAQVITYPDLGHMPMEEDPGRTVIDALNFLKSR